MATYTITLSRQGGTGSPNPLYYDSDLNVFYLSSASEPVTAVTPPTRTGYKFLGFFSEKGTGGTKYIYTTGQIPSSLAEYVVGLDSEQSTVYARWKAVTCTLSFDAHGGTLSGDSSLTVTYGSAIGTLPTVARNGYIFHGWYVNGEKITATTVWESTEDATAIPLWSASTWYQVAFDANGGTLNSPSTLYFNNTSGWYTAKNTSLTYEISRITPPTRSGYIFGGFAWPFEGGEKVYADCDGKMNHSIAEPLYLEVKAVWDPPHQVITLDANGGTGGTAEIYHADGVFYSDPACEEAVEFVTPPSKAGVFTGYYYNDVQVIDATGRITGLADMTISSDIVLTARYDTRGDPIDYFGLESGLVVCVESADGCVMSVIETSHGGALAIQTDDSDIGAHKIYGRQLNPVVTYRVIGSGSLSLTLGKAIRPGVRSATRVNIDGVRQYVMEKSGYMLVAFEYRTGADKIPTLTLFGAANEGFTRNSSGTITPNLTDAINQWTVTLDVNPDHVAQDVFTAIDGGGELVDCTVRGECQPVVPMEYGMPCASDVVRGKLQISAKTAAYGGEDAPTAKSPFLAVQVSESGSDADFAAYVIRAERSLY